MDIAEVTPRQLAPSVGILHVGSAISAASSSSTFDEETIYDAIYFDPETAAKSITFGSFDFTPHSPTSNLVFKSLRGSLDLAFGDLHFYVNNLGVLRLPNQIHPASTDSTAPPAAITISSTSSVGSSDEPEPTPTSIYCSDCDAHHAVTESGVIFEHDNDSFFNDIDSFDRNPRPTHLLCAAIDPLTGAEETDERRTERENIEKPTPMP